MKKLFIKHETQQTYYFFVSTTEPHVVIFKEEAAFWRIWYYKAVFIWAFRGYVSGHSGTQYTMDSYRSSANWRLCLPKTIHAVDNLRINWILEESVCQGTREHFNMHHHKFWNQCIVSLQYLLKFQWTIAIAYCCSCFILTFQSWPYLHGRPYLTGTVNVHSNLCSIVCLCHGGEAGYSLVMLKAFNWAPFLQTIVCHKSGTYCICWKPILCVLPHRDPWDLTKTLKLGYKFAHIKW